MTLVSFSAAVVLALLAHRSALAGGFAPAETNDSQQPVILAEFRAPVAVALGGPSFPTTAAEHMSPPALVSPSAPASPLATVFSPAPPSRGFRAPEAGPDDEVAPEPSGSAAPVPELPLWASSPAGVPLGIELAPLGPPPVDFAVEPLSGSSLTGNPLASLLAVVPNEGAWPPLTMPEYIPSLPEGIARLPSLVDVSLRTDAVPTLADPGDNTSAADTPAGKSSSESDSAEELPVPDADGDAEVVEGIEVDGELVDGEIIETYGWSYLGLWLNERFIPKRIEAGGTYGSGARRSWSAQLNARWKVEEDRYDDDFTIDGVYTEVDDERSNNEWIARETFDWKRADGSPWRLFVKGHAEYDEIEHLSFRGTASTGLGYAWLNEEDRKLITRAGPSYTYEKFFDPVDTNEKPELLAEVELKWELFGQLMFEHKTSAYPAFTEADGIRVSDETGLLTPIGTSPFWSWKLGLRHQYNNKPNADVPRNTYQASLLLVYDR